MFTPMVQKKGTRDGRADTDPAAAVPGGFGMRVNVHLNTKAAELLLDGVVDVPPVRDILRAAKELGVKLAPLYPKSRNRRLKSEFVVEVPDVATAERVVDHLSGLAATKAAYVKPGPQLP
jgi:hypothetical protein